MNKGSIYLNTLILCTIIIISLSSIIVIVNKNNKEISDFTHNNNNYNLSVGLNEQVLKYINNSIDKDYITTTANNIFDKEEVIYLIYSNLTNKSFSYNFAAKDSFRLNSSIAIKNNNMEITSTCTNRSTNTSSVTKATLDLIFVGEDFHLEIIKLREID